MPRISRLRLVALVPILLVAGCITTKPIILQPRFVLPANTSWALPRKAPDAPACTVALASIRDVRADKQAMGLIEKRPIRATDTAAWLRLGFENLSQDRRIKITSDADATIVLNAEMLKAYLLSINLAKSATVVLRVHYITRGSPPDEQVYRGDDTSVNWDGDQGETEDSFNSALAQVLKAVDRDVIAHCKGTPLSARGDVKAP